ncbi:MAG TPA: hypothetical protein VM531_10850 [Sphingomicrobium sp.]|nr:hypothetical protein [Sphingomicrobium sp.]
MPRNRIISRIDDELVIAKESLAFWRDQTFLADVSLRDCARSAVRLREEEIAHLVEIQEALASRCNSAD